jgi:hypothetical protein
MTGMWRGLLRIMAATSAIAAAQQTYDPLKPLTPEEILLGRIRVVAAQAFARLPNFTCVETIERSRRLAPNKKYEFLDTVRLEVAYVDGKELYSWPGETRFEERDLPRMVGGSGAIGTGDFALHAKSVLLGPMVEFSPAVIEEMNGRPVYRLNFRLSIKYSNYLLRILPDEGVIGYSGTTWHDKETLDLLRLEVILDEIPPNLPLKRGEKRIYYKRTAIGESSFLLPVSMDMTLTHMNGTESRNQMTFASCRQYLGESTLIFEEPAAGAKPVESKVEITLPGGLAVPLKLRTPLDLGKAARGDLIETETGREVKRQEVVLMPKGARVRFRISRVACYSSPLSHCWLALLPERFDFDNKSGTFKAIVDPPMLETSMAILLRGVSRQQIMKEQMSLGDLEPGAGVIVVRGEKQLPSGYQMLWRTLKD